MFNPFVTLRPYVSLEDDLDPSNYEVTLWLVVLISHSIELFLCQALLTLAERLGEAKPQGLSKSRIDQLDSYRYKQGTHCSDQPM